MPARAGPSTADLAALSRAVLGRPPPRSTAGGASRALVGDARIRHSQPRLSELTTIAWATGSRRETCCATSVPSARSVSRTGGRQATGLRAAALAVPGARNLRDARRASPDKLSDTGVRACARRDRGLGLDRALPGLSASPGTPVEELRRKRPTHSRRGTRLGPLRRCRTRRYPGPPACRRRARSVPFPDILALAVESVAGRSQRAFAARIGMTEATVSYWKDDRRRPSLLGLLRECRATGSGSVTCCSATWQRSKRPPRGSMPRPFRRRREDPRYRPRTRPWRTRGRLSRPRRPRASRPSCGVSESTAPTCGDGIRLSARRSAIGMPPMSLRRPRPAAQSAGGPARRRFAVSMRTTSTRARTSLGRCCHTGSCCSSRTFGVPEGDAHSTLDRPTRRPCGA